MEQKIIKLQKELMAKRIEEFEILSYKDFQLKIAGSFDFEYYHEVEITFYGVSFTSCATKFGGAKIRFATDEERWLLINNHTITYMEANDTVICFEVNEGIDKYYIVAERFNYVFEEVLYYKRENFSKNQRMMELIK